MTRRQLDNKAMIETIAGVFGIDPKWAVAVAMVESSLGEHQVSPTGCSGVFQMSSIAMKDLLITMREQDDDLVDIVCGVAFLRLLKRRWHTEEEATAHFCDPKERGLYLERVKKYMEQMDDLLP
jgi:hypothetical protein